ncbi:DnaB-like helicase N-terminal domain-containing protein [Cellulomonas endophytica]|uniref:DnaB-like helicase N-terminal domain-containing protein n=1 Tax=Cellulomonas endophytica TaxID=2494735 RepID=UPI001F0C59C5|nr:DnaB-like helicase N-terminal domain-containing protein [Cellulomonas endophytica]
MDEVLRLAERSTIGALILHPAALAQVRRWLRASDFCDAWHAGAYTVLLERHTAGTPIDTGTIGAALIERGGTAHQHLTAIADAIHVLPHSQHGLAYARMVADTGMRREITGLGVLLEAAALQSALEQHPRPMTAVCDVVDAGLDAVAHRSQLSELTGRHPRPQPSQEPVAVLAARLGADKYLRAHPTRDTALESEHVAALLGALLDRPPDLPRVTAWWTPQRIAHPGWRAVYATILDLADRHEPVDPLTVAWALRTTTHHRLPAPSTAQVLAAVEQGRWQSTTTLIRAVAGDQLRAMTERGSTAWATAAANPGVHVIDLTDLGHTLTTALRITATALQPAAPAANVATVAPVVRLNAREAVLR